MFGHPSTYVIVFVGIPNINPEDEIRLIGQESKEMFSLWLLERLCPCKRCSVLYGSDELAR